MKGRDPLLQGTIELTCELKLHVLRERRERENWLLQELQSHSVAPASRTPLKVLGDLVMLSQCQNPIQIQGQESLCGPTSH